MSGVRGALTFTDAIAVWVIGSDVYRADTSATLTLIGTGVAGTGPVSMASNGIVIMVVTGPTGYIVNPWAVPLQKPYPPLWYPTHNPSSVEYAARHGYHFATLGPIAHIRNLIEQYKEKTGCSLTRSLTSILIFKRNVRLCQHHRSKATCGA